MQAFEKWRDEQKINSRSYKADAGVWRAALNWIKKQSEELCSEIPESAIGDIINKELKEELDADFLSWEQEESDDYRRELCAQADYWGMESLTEDQQYLILHGKEVKE